jgi:hypothetical protein
VTKIRIVDGQIGALAVRCLFTGCDWKGTLDDKQNNHSDCPLKPIACTNDGCDWKGTTGAYPAHYDECPHRVVDCSFWDNGCGHECKVQDLAAHVAACSFRIIPCPFAFTIGGEALCVSIMQKDEEKHMADNIIKHLSATAKLYTYTFHRLQNKISRVAALEKTQLAMQDEIKELRAIVAAHAPPQPIPTSTAVQISTPAPQSASTASAENEGYASVA